MVDILDVLKKEDRESQLYMLFDLSQNKALHFDLELYFDEMLELYITDNEKLKEVSPYILKVDLNNKNQLDWLKKNVVGEHIAIFFFSLTEMNLLRNYFSNMTTIWSSETQTHNEGEAYFAFYDPRVFKGFLLGLGEESQTFFDYVEVVYVEDEFNSALIYGYQRDETKEKIEENCFNLKEIKEEKRIFKIEESKRGFDFTQEIHPLLTEYMKQKLEENEVMRKVKKIAYQIEDTFQEHFVENSIEVLISMTQESVSRMRNYGFSQYKHLYALASWEVFYGKGYETLDSDGKLEEICLSSISEEKKFENFSYRLQSLKTEESLNGKS